MDTLTSIDKPPEPGSRYKRLFKTAAALVPLLMALASWLFGDVQPMVRDVCSALLPPGSVK